MKLVICSFLGLKQEGLPESLLDGISPDDFEMDVEDEEYGVE